MPAITLTVNGTDHRLDAPAEMPLLWVLRDHLGLTGTKYACGAGLCGSCTVHVDGVAARSCVVPAASLIGRTITTIEGLSENGDHPVQQAWVEGRVSQCGYCQPGQIMAAAALLTADPRPDANAIAATMNDLLCRCGTYQRIRATMERLAGR